VHKHIFAAIITHHKAEALLRVEKLNDASRSANIDAGAHVARCAWAAEATTAAAAATAEATTAAASAAAAEAATTTAAAAKAITAAAAETVAATAETVAPAKAALKLVEPALALVETTTPGTTPAFIKAHFISRSFMYVKVI
jgi:hypothetical protein